MMPISIKKKIEYRPPIASIVVYSNETNNSPKETQLKQSNLMMINSKSHKVIQNYPLNAATATATIKNKDVIDDREVPGLKIGQIPFRFRVLGLNSRLSCEGKVSTSHCGKVDELVENLRNRQKAINAASNIPKPHLEKSQPSTNQLGSRTKSAKRERIKSNMTEQSSKIGVTQLQARKNVNSCLNSSSSVLKYTYTTTPQYDKTSNKSRNNYLHAAVTAHMRHEMKIGEDFLISGQNPNVT